MATPEQASYQCLAYCIMKRPSGFLLCVPEGFLAAEELDQGQQAEEAEGIGPSFAVSAPAVRLNHDGEWISAPEQELVHAVVVDLTAHMSAQVSPADFHLRAASTKPKSLQTSVSKRGARAESFLVSLLVL